MTGRVWGAFIALCTLSASAWCLPAMSATARLAAGALAYTLLSVLAVVLWRTSSYAAAGRAAAPTTTWLEHVAPLVTTALAAGGVIAGPALLLEPARALAGSANAAAMLSLAPMAVAVTLAVRRGEALQSTLGACVLGVAGMLALLPIAEPRSLAALEGLGLGAGAAVLAGASAVITFDRLRSLPLSRALLIAASANAGVLWAGLLFQHGTSPLLAQVNSSSAAASVAFDIVSGGLALFLVRTMSPLAYAARFLWVPLLAAIEAYFATQPSLSWRTVAGACMLASGGALLLRPPSDVSGEILGLR